MSSFDYHLVLPKTLPMKMSNWIELLSKKFENEQNKLHALDLLYKLLHLDPKLRIDIDSILNHPFIFQMDE